MKHIKKSDYWEAARWVMGPEESWGPEYYLVIFDVQSSLEAIVKTGDLQAYDKSLHRWEDEVDCHTLVSGTIDAGKRLLGIKNDKHGSVEQN